MTSKQRRAEWKAAGMCRDGCGRPAEQGKTLCTECLMRNKQRRNRLKSDGLCRDGCGRTALSGKTYCSVCLLKIKKWRNKNAEGGLCKDGCGNFPMTGHAYCEKCLAQRRGYYKRMKAAGMCIKGCGNRALPRQTRCAECASRDSAVTSKKLQAIRRGKHGELSRITLLARDRLHNAIKAKGYTKRSRTHQLLGCSYEELLMHLGPKPSPDAHIDHICPCAQARTEDELLRLQHHWNLRWLPASENLSKHDAWTQEGEELCQTLLGRPWCYD